MSNRLSISIMSLRDYPSDDEGPSAFYVRVTLDGQTTVQTEVKSPRAPGENVQFMEHLVIPYKQPKKEELKFELLQSSKGGDLVLGECKMRVIDVVQAGAVHSWFPFVDSADPDLKAGELLMAIQAKKGGQSAGQAQQSVTTSVPERPQGSRPSIKLPMPLALVAAVLMGAYSFTRTKKPVYYVVEEGDTLCTISECYNASYQDVYSLNRKVVTDPDLIYPGDRLRVA